MAVSALLVWQAVGRLLHPTQILGLVSVITGLAAAVANWGVARFLLRPSRDNPAIRLAYIHNIGDVLVSLAPVLAGLLVILTGHWFFDPLIALAIGLWIIVSTVREVVRAREELMWPERITCGHSDQEEAIASLASH